MINHTIRLTAIAVISAAATATTAAQQLNKEITVEREVVPIQREATRLGFTPSVSLPPLAMERLSPSTRAITSRVPAGIVVLDPAAWADSIYISPYRGYASIGFMPLYNAMLSAGYRMSTIPPPVSEHGCNTTAPSTPRGAPPMTVLHPAGRNTYATIPPP